MKIYKWFFIPILFFRLIFHVFYVGFLLNFFLFVWDFDNYRQFVLYFWFEIFFWGLEKILFVFDDRVARFEVSQWFLIKIFIQDGHNFPVSLMISKKIWKSNKFINFFRNCWERKFVDQKNTTSFKSPINTIAPR